MTFHARLSELIAKKGNWEVSHDGDYSIVYVNYADQGIKLPLAEVYNNMQETDSELIAYLVNHAEAIRDLVVAAENLTKDFNQFSHGRSKEEDEMIKALAKLEEA